jgi:glycosyltransferase involved in cell wall biosynthesis
MRGVLAGVAQVMEEDWHMEYLTNYRGPDAAAHLEIRTFGHRLTHPWQFPGVWLYSLAGLSKLCTVLRRDPHCHLILPQDGVFTGAFAALVGKLAGRRVVCMDHGNVTWLNNPALRRERMKSVHTSPRLRRLSARLRFALYWASLPLLARLAVRWTDLFLVAGDEVEEVYRYYLGVHASRIVRYAYMVDVSRFPRLDAATRLHLRAEQKLPAGAILITMINRLASEKGMDIALAGIARAFEALPPEVRGRVRVMIAGDGPLRAQVQDEIERYDLREICLLWGEAKPAEVVALLSISDIFLYSGTRGTNYSMAVLEAMAAGCAVVASTVPRSNARLLAEGRGIAIAPGDAEALADALTRLCREPEQCRRMGDLARDYVATYHTAAMLKRDLSRATFFVPSIGE